MPRQRTSGATRTFTATIELGLLLTHVTLLGHGDVTKKLVISRGENRPSTAHIWLCCFIFLRHGAKYAIRHSDCDAKDLHKFGGYYPACIGFGYPEKAFGRQNACWRAVVYNSCGPDDGKWFCSDYSKPVS